MLPSASCLTLKFRAKNAVVDPDLLGNLTSVMTKTSALMSIKFADSEVRMASRFASSTQQEIEKKLEDKDSENTKRSTKVAKELFYKYLKEKNIQEPHDKKELSQVLKSSYVEARKKDGSFVVIFFKTMYNKTIIRFGFCDIRNNQGLGKCYQLQPSASADNTYHDLDYSGYNQS